MSSATLARLVSRCRGLTDRAAAVPDAELLRRFVHSRDADAFAELLSRNVDLVWGVCRRTLPQEADCEDAFQATFLALARNARSIDPQRPLGAWLHAVAVRVSRRALGRTLRRRMAELPDCVGPTDVLRDVSSRDLFRAVDAEIARLPAALRGPVILCCLEGKARDEAAEALGCSVLAVKARLERGRLTLRQALARRGIALPTAFFAIGVGATRVGANVKERAIQSALGSASPAVARLAASGISAHFGLMAMALTAVVAVGVAVFGITQGQLKDPLPAAKETPATPPKADAKARMDRFGDPLPDGAITRFGTVRFRHGGQLTSIAYSPDGKTIASGGFGRIMLWEAETGKPIGPLVRTVEVIPPRGKPAEKQVQHGQTFGLAFTPDGKQLISVGSPASGDKVGSYVFWDVADRKLTADSLVEDVDRTHWVRAVTMAPDGKTAAIGTDSGRLYLLDTKTHAVLRQTKLDGVAGLSFSPDSKLLAVSTYQEALVLDSANLLTMKRFEPGGGRQRPVVIRQVAFAPDGKSVWIGRDGGSMFKKDDHPGTIGRWDLESGAVAQTFETAPNMVMALRISPDGKTLASGGVSSGPFLWDTTTGKAVDLDSSGSRIRPWIQSLAFAPDGKTLAVADTNGRVRVWDVAARQELHRNDENASSILKAALSPDGKHAATAGGDGAVRIWDMDTGRSVRSWTADESRSVFTVAYAPDGKQLLTSGWDGTVRFWDAATGKEVRRLREEKGGVGARAALSPDGKLVAASSKDGISITLYETATGRPVRDLTGHISFLMWLKFSPDGRRLISAADIHGDGGKTFDDRSVRVWDVATGNQLHKFDAGRPHGEAAVSPDGRVVATAGYIEEEKAGQLRFWDTVTGKEIAERRLKGHWTNSGVGAAAFSPDGRLLATADRDIRLFETASGRQVQMFESGAGSANGLTFTSDGRRLISAHNDGTALVWDVTVRPAIGADPGKLWEELASDDAAAARRAAVTLAADPAAAMAMLSDRLKPVPKPAATRTTAVLIADLDASAFGVREAASRELLGRVAMDFAELSDTLASSPSAEVRQRLSEILRSAPLPLPRLDAEDLRRVRAVGVLEAIGTPEARRLLKALAEGDPAARLTAEARAALVRGDAKTPK
jgi:RNA polymerase sigma factor (sigma-70 family)